MKVTRRIFGEPWPDDVPEVAEFDGTAAGLAQVPFVATWVNSPNFARLVQSDDLLMAEFHSGAEWYVIGYLAEHVPGLPVWDSAAAMIRSKLREEAKANAQKQDEAT